LALNRHHRIENVTEAQQFDTVITGGEVIDPGTNTVGKFDVGIRDGRIAAVTPMLSPAAGKRHIDATGKYVTPGLVDLHTHVYWGATYWGIEADPVAARTGVTSWVDVGSAGGYSFPGFREYIVKRNKSRIYAMLNLSSIGLIAPTWELANPDYWDVDLAAEIVERNRDVIVGIKVRIDRNTCRGVGIEPMKKARELADRVGLPLMTHIGSAPPTIEELIPLLRPGDILTHCFTWQDMGIMGEDGKVRPEIAQLQKDGLILDIGHGTGSFGFDVAEAMMAQGIVPDCISTDIHQMAVQGPMFDLPTTLSKFLALGMSLPDAIQRATINPARAARLEGAGTLAPGAAADLAIFRLETGDYTFYDVKMNDRAGGQRLVNELTMLEGEELPKLPEREIHFWASLPEGQQPIHLAKNPGQRVPTSTGVKA
jgi:dihydroorotase